MQMRYRYVTNRYREGSQKQLELHYRQILNDALRQQQTILHRSDSWRPPADILESETLIRVKVELAGMKEEEIDVTLYEDALVISGKRHDDYEDQDGLSYREAQIRYGPFRVEVYIATPVVRDAVTAHYEHGMLAVDLPKLSADPPGRIVVQGVANTE